MPRFKKKPVIIEAFQVGSSPLYPDWLRDAITANIVVTHGSEEPLVTGWGEAFDNADIRTLEGLMHARRDDWIIQGVKGELYPCNPDIFTATYEAVASA